MITKERLEELIKEGATIYILDFVGNLREYQLGVSDVSDGIDYWLFTIIGRLFERKQDGEKAMKELKWALKYHATRTEELDLPMWEEIKDIKNNKTIVSFYAKDKETDTVYMYMYAKHLIVETEYKEFLNTEFTEENYIKACDLCLKLFEGEENE